MKKEELLKTLVLTGSLCEQCNKRHKDGGYPCYSCYEEQLKEYENEIKAEVYKKLLDDIKELKLSPWFNHGKPRRGSKKDPVGEVFANISYIARKEAIEVIEDLCIKKEMKGTAADEKNKW